MPSASPFPPTPTSSLSSLPSMQSTPSSSPHPSTSSLPSQGQAQSFGGVPNHLFPALYLYPLNDTWAPKHISLTNQHTKIGRQTSSKTAPGERNGFFDSKVLSRQHAEVWEEGGKIFIKDVKSSNGTFINGERLSGEGHESEPFELKSDDIVEFGIDIVGEDNKTIIHHKVAARVVCVFNEQDAQVAARAEQHQAQQQLQQQQHFLSGHGHGPGGGPGAGIGGPGAGGAGVMNGAMGGGASSIGVGGTIGAQGGNQNFPFSAQRRAQLAQQGLGSMGGMRPPGKTGLSFDVILSRLQGEVQKSRETGAELSSLTGTMGEIGDVLGGVLPAMLPPFPAQLPPVKPAQLPAPAATALSQEPVAPLTTGVSSTEPAPTTTTTSSPPASVPAAATISGITASAVLDLQSQLHETQSSLASHLEKVQALEGVLKEQEEIRREVGVLRGLLEERERRRVDEERKREIEEEEKEEEMRMLEERMVFREGRDTEGGVEVEDDEDDARSVGTIRSHELESVEEVDEEEELVDPSLSTSRNLQGASVEKVESDRPQPDSVEDEYAEAAELKELPTEEMDAEAEVRKQEDLQVGRPRTPEPSRLGIVGGVIGLTRRASLGGSVSSPLSQVQGQHQEDVYEQLLILSTQLSKVVELAATLEAQQSSAQSTIKALEMKVGKLEGLLKAEEGQISSKPDPTTSEPEEAETVQDDAGAVDDDDLVAALAGSASVGGSTSSLVGLLTQWKKSVEGQWSPVREEWNVERERLARAREEWEARKIEWTTRAADWEVRKGEWKVEEEIWRTRKTEWETIKGDWDAKNDEWRNRESEWEERKIDWELRKREVETGLDKVVTVSERVGLQQRDLNSHLAGLASVGSSQYLNGDMKHGSGANSGLVTPPSPRSQSSDSEGRRAYASSKKHRRRGSNTGGRPRGRSGSSSPAPDTDGERDDEADVGTDADTEATLASSTEDDHIREKSDLSHAVRKEHSELDTIVERQLATPEPSVYAVSSSIGSLEDSPLKGLSLRGHPLQESVTRSNTGESEYGEVKEGDVRGDEMNTSSSKAGHGRQTPHNISVQTAVGVLLLSVAAAAVFWKVKPET